MALDYARYLRAQDPVWSSVLAELRLGRKQTHWMWFVFPQLRSLGRSETSIFFGLESADDARDYMAHPMLCDRMEEACALVSSHRGKDIKTIFGDLDAKKLQSSMTLFETTPQFAATADDLLTRFFDGKRCDDTLSHLSASATLVPGQ